MLSSLENYYWRYTSASELVNMILAFVETRAVQVGGAITFFLIEHPLYEHLWIWKSLGKCFNCPQTCKPLHLSMTSFK